MDYFNAEGILFSVLITGCNRGLGLEMVRYLLSLKNPPRYLFATCRDIDTSSTLRSYNGFWNRRTKVSVLEMEVNDEYQVSDAVAFIEDKLEGIGLSLLINNAETHVRKDLEAVCCEDMRRAFQTNTVAPLMIAKAFHSTLSSFVLLDNAKSQKNAAIVNISSVMGSISSNEQGGMYPYRACKAALNMVTKCLSIDLKDNGIIVVSIHPRKQENKEGPLPYSITAPNIIEFISSLDMSDTGGFYSYNGTPIPF